MLRLNPDQVQNQSLSTKGTGSELICAISKRGNQVNGIVDISKVIAETGISLSKMHEDEAS